MPNKYPNAKILKSINHLIIMINEWGGVIFSGIALIGASGIAVNKFQIESLLLIGFVGMILFSMLWVYLSKRKIHMFVASFFAGIYLIVSYLYIGANNLFVAGYFLFSIGTMIYAVKEIADEKNH